MSNMGSLPFYKSEPKQVFDVDLSGMHTKPYYSSLMLLYAIYKHPMIKLKSISIETERYSMRDVHSWENRIDKFYDSYGELRSLLGGFGNPSLVCWEIDCECDGLEFYANHDICGNPIIGAPFNKKINVHGILADIEQSMFEAKELIEKYEETPAILCDDGVDYDDLPFA